MPAHRKGIIPGQPRVDKGFPCRHQLLPIFLHRLAALLQQETPTGQTTICPLFPPSSACVSVTTTSTGALEAAPRADGGRRILKVKRACRKGQSGNQSTWVCQRSSGSRKNKESAALTPEPATAAPLPNTPRKRRGGMTRETARREPRNGRGRLAVPRVVVLQALLRRGTTSPMPWTSLAW